MTTTIHIENHGPLITSSNYWRSPAAKAGKILASCNAGAIRVLLPLGCDTWFPDLRQAKHVVVSRGPWPEENLPDAVEILWEDGRDDPIAWHLSPECWLGGMPAEPDPGREWVVSAWAQRAGKPHRVIDRVAHWRRVEMLPCLEEWAP